MVKLWKDYSRESRSDVGRAWQALSTGLGDVYWAFQQMERVLRQQDPEALAIIKAAMPPDEMLARASYTVNKYMMVATERKFREKVTPEGYPAIEYL